MHTWNEPHSSYAASGRAPRGFTMVELAVTILVLGLLFAVSVPTIQTLSGSYQLKANTENIAAQLRMMREKAIATGSTQEIHFTYNFSNSDYHIHNGGYIPAKWNLTKGITYYWGGGTTSAFRMTPRGQSQWSGLLILQDPRGNRDTVSVQVSGLVLTK